MNEPIITTNPARCRDCYRCVRSCEVKAIRVRDGQAQVIPELCILCGTCVRVCPQQAKSVRSSAADIQQARAQGRLLIATVAPSAPAFFDMSSFADLEEALRALGFHAAEETAVGAQIVGLAHREYVERTKERWPVITSSCPVVINLVEQYHPDLIPHLAPLVSPMIAHGRLLRQRYGQKAYIVFIGPCIAKKMEMSVSPVAGVIDTVMTFQGLKDWLDEKGIICRPSAEIAVEPPAERGRLFPVEGGLIGTAHLNTDLLDRRMVVASGLDACRDVLEGIREGHIDASLVELLACKGGCINGPSMAGLSGGITLARQKVIAYNARHQPPLLVDRADWPPLDRSYQDRKDHVPAFSEEQIQEVMHRVNKYTPEDELNCGACGYSSCREKAIATLRGMAEPMMCIPYMRRRSESLCQVVMDASPNSILIIDDHLNIHEASPSSEILFRCSMADVVGKHLSCLIPVMDDFIHVRDSGEAVIGKVRRLLEDLVVELTIVRVEGQPLMIAILRDVTERQMERDRFDALREETIQRTREVLSKQMRVAHEIAHLLGETTAESKTIVSHLARLLEEDTAK